MGLFDRLSLSNIRREGILLTSPLLGSNSARASESSDRDNEVVSTAGGAKQRKAVSLVTRSKAIILLCLSCLILLLLVSLPAIDASSSSYTDNLKALHADITGKIAAKWREATTTSSSSSSTTQGLDRSWDYYAQNGIFVNARNNQTIPHNRKARFIPVDKIDEFAEKGLTGLEGEVKLGDGFDEIGKYVQAVNHARPSALSDLSYLQNKTVLLIGDSIDRFSLDFTCRSILYGSSLSYRELHHEPHDLSKITRGGNDLDEFSEPHKCEVNPSFFKGTSIWSLMVYGVTSEEEEWQHKPQTLHPRKYDAKIRYFAEKFEESNNGMKPDLIILNTVLWDLATFNLRDAKSEIEAQEFLSWNYLKEFKDKTLDLLELVTELWPDAAKMYRPNHAMRHGSDGTWFLQGLNPMPKSISRSPYMPNKVLQLNQIVDEILSSKTNTERRKPFWPFDIRHAMQEYVLDFQDSVHTGNTGRTIYAQMLAYYIKMLT